MSIRETVGQLPAWFTESPTGRAIVEAQERKEQAARQADADAVARIERDLDAAVKARDAELAPLEARIATLRAEVGTTEYRLLTARQRHETVVYGLEAQRARLQAGLIASAPAAIDAAITALDRKFEGLRGKLYETRIEPTGTFNLRRNRPNERTLHNDRAVRRLSDAIVGARRQLVSLKSAPFSSTALDLAIAAIVDRIDWSVDTFESVA